MRTALKVSAWIVGVAILVCVAVVAFVAFAINSDLGRSVVETAVARASGGTVALSGLSGHLPDDIRIARAEVRDGEGPWLIADNVALQWSPSRLSRREVQVERISAGRVQLLRRPALKPSAEKPSEPFELKGRVDIDRLEVEQLDIGASIAGAAATVAVRGAAHVASTRDAEATIEATRIDGPGTYKLTGRIDDRTLHADLVVDEPARGLASGLVGLPDLGGLSLNASIDGPRNAEAARFELAAGDLRASGRGLVDLVGCSVDLDVTASAPAMTPRPDLAWKSVRVQAHVHGPFTGPDATGELRIDELKAGGGAVRGVRAELEGNRGAVALHATLDRLRVPGPKPALFESSPVDLRAEARLDDPARPVTFAIAHPLMNVRGRANTGGALSGNATVALPSLAPFAAIAGVDLKGRTTFETIVTMHDGATDVTVDGTAGVTGGFAPAPALIGNAAKVILAATIRGEEIALKRAEVEGKALRVSAAGTTARERLDVDWKVALSDLSAVNANVSGEIAATGHVRGVRESFEVVADATGNLGTKDFPREPIQASIRLDGLPDAPKGTIEASGTLEGSPLEVALGFDREREGALRGTIRRADWKSVHAEGELALSPGDRVPQGRVTIRVAKLEDLRELIGQPLEGSLAADVGLAPSGGRVQAKVGLDARNVAVAGSRVAHLTVAGTVDDPTTQPSVALHVAADGIESNGVTGSAKLEASGPQDALRLTLAADLHHATQGDVPLQATATLDAAAKRVSVAALQAKYKGEPVKLLAPVEVSFADGVALDRLRIGMQQAVLEVSGRITPTLDATASLRNVTPAVARTFGADLQADGMLTLDARLGGTVDDPRGTVKVAASGLRMRTGSAARLPAATVSADAEIAEKAARVDVKVAAGSQSRLEATGRVPLSTNGAIDLQATGTIDATVANPILEVNGRRAKGKIAVDLALAGTLDRPRIDGQVRLVDGELEDYALGVQLTKIDARIEAAGDTLTIAKLDARAGPGTVAASGTLGLLAPGRPVDVKLTARNAKPFATDLLTANLDADITLRGSSETRLDAAGRIDVHRAEINIPKALPPEVGVLTVRRPGEGPPVQAPPGLVVGLDLNIDAPRAVFVHGRGLEAETGGSLHVTGTNAAPQVSGGFDLRRGTFDLGARALNFTSGKVTFNGTGVTQKIDPWLDFLAENTVSNVTARLAVTGYASSPRIALTSTPEMPQDEILARLLFGVSAKELTPLQLAQIAGAIATITGVGGDNPLAAVQKSLGLDRLSTGSTPTGGTTVEAGRYVAERVYLGAKQNSQGGTQAQIQYDITKNLKLQATLGAGGTVPVQGTTPENDPGSSVGLSYQFEY